MSSADHRNTWGLLSRQYTEEYEQCIESIVPTETAVYDYENLLKAVEKLSDFERKANNRVTKKLSSENLNANVHVLSYCWCGDVIRSAFSSGGISFGNVMLAAWGAVNRVWRVLRQQ
ncbi:hypothetical protein C1H46_011914 [Malus baccata]|uniref:Uncharacterized protein n=1 Tax=Malus baccata TaxID=106549 RepID=A0A540MUN1_MALBA|nr:hypothetical protein C1H46_011914 [Malus baccata]